MSAGITSSSDGLSIGLRVNTANVVTFDSSGVMTLIGTGNRITGDFSNATVANRAAFQTSTANSATNLTLLPTGTAARITYEGYSTSDGLNASSFSLGVIPGSGDVTFRSSITGTGTYLPMTFYNGGFEAMRLATTGRLTTNKAASGIVVTLVDGATITPDFDAGNYFSVTLGGNRTLANPTNLVVGQSGVIKIVQDATGSRTLAFGSYWDFAGGVAPTLTLTANAVDILAYYVDSSTNITARLIGDRR